MVNRPVPSKEYPEREGFREHQPERCRKVSHPDEMINLVEAQNERLTRAGHVKMIFEEFVAGRLYTGPMYHKYNTVLRSKSGEAHLVDKCRELCKENDYPTTIHAINSYAAPHVATPRGHPTWPASVVVAREPPHVPPQMRHQAVEADDRAQGVARLPRREAAHGLLGAKRGGRRRRRRVWFLLDDDRP